MSYMQGRGMFEDRRSKRVVFVAHCVLNQNAKIDGCAQYPGAMWEVLQVLVASGCGIAQLPCPELIHLGLDRRVDTQASRTIESEDTRVGQAMEASAGVLCCRRIAEEAAHQVEEYLRNGFVVLGMLGINGSPTCGVETTWSACGETAGRGVLIRELDEACKRRGVSLGARGIKAGEPAEATRVATEVSGGAA